MLPIQARERAASREVTRPARRIPQLAAVCLVAGITAGCAATPPTKYYVLDEPPAAQAPSEAPGAVRLVVGRITASSLYRDNRLVYGTGQVELGTYEFQRWSEPPVDLVQDMLVAALRNSGQYRGVSRIGSLARGDYIVRGHLDALEEIDNKPGIAARFTLELELFNPSTGSIVWSDSYNHDEPVPGKRPSVPEVIEALDRNVATGIGQLTSNLNRYLASRTQPQPAGN
jgi:ABC-type uncharacterized transport system auxiliary subunit